MFSRALHRAQVVSRPFHTSTPRRIHPLVWFLAKPFLKGVAFLTGRSTRIWFRSLPKEKRVVVKEHLRQQTWKYVAGIGFVGAAASAHYYLHLQVAPITGRKRYIMMNPDQIETLSALEKERITTEYQSKFMPENSPPTQLVAKIATGILTANMDIDLVKAIKWNVRVIDIPEKNAFVLPTGDIFVTVGMLQAVKNEHQLAVVIGHELSHALLGHSAEKLSYLQIVDLIGIFVAFGLWAFLPTDWTALLVTRIFESFMTFTRRLPYSRKLEQEADEVGLTLAAKACFDVRESVTFWTSEDKDEKEEEKIPEFFSTHPANIKRAENLREKLPEVLKLRDQCNCEALSDKAEFEFLKTMLKQTAGSIDKILTIQIGNDQIDRVKVKTVNS